MHIDRKITEIIVKSKKSVLLLGPRQAGKSTLIRSLKPDLTINLADQQTYLEFLRNAAELRQRLGAHKTIFIDEVQRIPSLLNTVQAIVDSDSSLKFYLTGSSARKLKRGQANLLPGRLFTYELGPLNFSEIGSNPDYRKLLTCGCLPGVYLEEDSAAARKLLRSYAATYLREEVQAEALTRNLEGFSRFFDVIASRAGDFVDFSKVASQSAVERTSARRYYDILIDTLIVHSLDAFTKGGRKRLVQHPRYYFFDVGVLNGTLANFEASADRIGNLFEHLCLQMIFAEAQSRDEPIRVSTYRTEAGAEVDFIVERGNHIYALEVKATRNIDSGDLRGLKNFAQYLGRPVRQIVLYLGEHPLSIDGIEAIPAAQGILSLFE